MFYLRLSVLRQLIRVLAQDLPGGCVEVGPLEELRITRLARPEEDAPNRIFGRAAVKLLKHHVTTLRCLILAQKSEGAKKYPLAAVLRIGSILYLGSVAWKS